MVLIKNPHNVTDCQEPFQSFLARSLFPQLSKADANDVHILQIRELRLVAVRKETRTSGKQKTNSGSVAPCEFLIAGTGCQMY